MDRNPSEYDPYALEVVPFSSADQGDFYTMSVRGVTHYVDGASADFASKLAGSYGIRHKAAQHSHEHLRTMHGLIKEGIYL